jgi:hypothetical protein
MPKTEFQCPCGNGFVAEEPYAEQVSQCQRCGEVLFAARSTGGGDKLDVETYSLQQSTSDDTDIIEQHDGLEPERTCSKCQKRMGRGAVICIHCGWDWRSGECHRTRTSADIEGEEVRVFMGWGSGVPPKGKCRTQLRGRGTLRFRADGLRVRGRVFGEPVIAAVLAVPLGITLTLLTQGLHDTLATYGGLMCLGASCAVCFVLILAKMEKVVSLNSDAAIHRAYFDAQQRLLVFGLENGRWACCRVPRKQLVEIRETLNNIYGKRLFCTRIARYSSAECMAVCVFLGTLVIGLTLGISSAIGLL